MPDPAATDPLPSTVQLWLGLALVVLLGIALLFMLFLMLVRRRPPIDRPKPTPAATPDPWAESARRIQPDDSAPPPSERG